MWRLIVLVAIVGAAFCAACGDSPKEQKAQVLPTTELSITQGSQSKTITVEVAGTEAQRETGLMWRQSLGEDDGMLFVFARDSSGGFWMKNTYVPLDIAYISEAGEVLGIVQGEPLDTTTLNPPGPYRYALEMRQGWFAGHGLGKGATVKFLKKLPQAT